MEGVYVIYAASTLPLLPRECDLLQSLLNQRIALRSSETNRRQAAGGTSEPYKPDSPADQVGEEWTRLLSEEVYCLYSQKFGAEVHAERRIPAADNVLAVTPAVERSGSEDHFSRGWQVIGGSSAFKIRVRGLSVCRMLCRWIRSGKIDGLPRKGVKIRFHLLSDPMLEPNVPQTQAGLASNQHPDDERRSASNHLLAEWGDADSRVENESDHVLTSESHKEHKEHSRSRYIAWEKRYWATKGVDAAKLDANSLKAGGAIVRQLRELNTTQTRCPDAVATVIRAMQRETSEQGQHGCASVLCRRQNGVEEDWKQDSAEIKRRLEHLREKLR